MLGAVVIFAQKHTTQRGQGNPLSVLKIQSAIQLDFPARVFLKVCFKMLNRNLGCTALFGLLFVPELKVHVHCQGGQLI